MCNTQDPKAEINAHSQASVRFDVYFHDGCPLTRRVPPHVWLLLDDLAVSAGIPLPSPLWVNKKQGRSTVWQVGGLSVSSDVVLATMWVSPTVTFGGTLKYRLYGVFLCQRTEQFCANSWANPMELVNCNHRLHCSRNQISSLCYCLWLQMELPHQLRKQLLLGWSLLILILM